MPPDEVGIAQNHTMGPARSFSHVAASPGLFIIAVNTIVAEGVSAFVLWPLGSWVAALGGILLGIAHFAFWVYLGWRNWQLNVDLAWTRFPTGRTVWHVS
ncbi:hypothetical protein [Nocardioides sp. SYSU D00065]|uniref:hypothetical protein n=1 Tax=Nocardioides sp. SYSU D00065 TaxID=2817378 RepID=UPI001B333359|nr:hypothetical protein [Nocardioides sp. SYSU D00065]